MMKSYRSALRLTAAAMVSGLLLVACAGDGTDSAGADRGTDDPAEGDQGATKPEDGESPQIAEGGGGDGPYIALSNAFLGNAWRQTMVSVFEGAAQEAVDEGLIGSYKAVNAPGENSPSEQLAQLRSLILEQPDAILINPASSTALSATIEQACEQGIIVIVFDSSVENAPCAYTLQNDYADWGERSTRPVLEAIGGAGNIVISRGVVGSAPEEIFYERQQEVIAEYPDVNVVAEVVGFCDSAQVQQELVGILPSLDENVEGYSGCGGGMGAVQAFQSADRDIPVVDFETSGAALEFWRDNEINNGSYGVLTDPGQSVAAMWMALELIEGNEMPQVLNFPLVFINEEERDAWADVLGSDQFAAYQWSRDQFLEQVQRSEAGEEPVRPQPTD